MQENVDTGSLRDFLGLSNNAQAVNTGKLKDFLGLSQEESGNPADAFYVGLKTGFDRGIHGYSQPTFESDRGALRELSEKASAAAGPLSPLSGYLTDKFASDFYPQQRESFNENMRNKSQSIAQKREDAYNEVASKNPIAAGAGDFVGNIGAMAPAFLLNPMSKATLAGEAANFALQGGLAAYGNYVNGNDPFSRWGNVAFGSAVGAAAAPIGKAISGTSNFLDDVFTKGPVNAFDDVMQRYVAPKVFAGVDPAIAIPNKQAGERIGTHLTPAEASRSNLAAKVQGRIGQSEQGALHMQKFGNERLAQERNAINTLKDTIAPGKSKTAVSPGYTNPDNLYNQSYNTKLPSGDFKELLNDPIIAKYHNAAVKDVLNKKVLDQYGKRSFAAMDLTKRKIDEVAEVAKRKGLKDTTRKLKEANSFLKTKLDALNNDYPLARQMAQRDIVRGNIERTINNVDAGGTEFYRRRLKGDTQFNSLKESVGHVPGGVEKVGDMRNAFSNLINPRTTSSTAMLSKSSLDVPRSTSEWFINKVMNGITAGKYDMAMAKLVTNPNWDKVLLQMQGMPLNQRSMFMANLLGKAAISQETKP